MRVAAAQRGELGRKPGIAEPRGKLLRKRRVGAGEGFGGEAQEFHRARKVGLPDEQLHLLVAEIDGAAWSARGGNRRSARGS